MTTDAPRPENAAESNELPPNELSSHQPGTSDTVSTNDTSAPSEPTPSETTSAETAPAEPTSTEAASAPVETPTPNVPPPAPAEAEVPETPPSLQEPESSTAPEPPETADAPETPTGDTTPSADAPSAEKPKIQMAGASDAAAVANVGDSTLDPSKQAVEIPSADEALDASLEAELDAALQGESAPADPAPTAEGDAAAGAPAAPTDELSPGQKLKGTVSSVAGDNVVVDLGVRMAGIIPARQFSKAPAEVGQQVDVVVDAVNEEEGTAACSLPSGSRKPAGNWDAVAVGQVVDALVKKTNKGGLEVMVGGLRGFMPASQVDLGFVENLEGYVEQKLTAKVLEVNPQRRKLVVSRRALLAEERKEKEGELFETLEKGKTVTGKVKSIKDFGAFVDLGGADGLLHIGQISWSRIDHPSDVLTVGQEIEVQILDVDTEKKKISLSMRQLQANPWSLAEQNYPVGSPVKGTVSRVADFGAFVKLEPGVEGLIHISQLDHKRVRAVGDVVAEGQEVEAKVLEVDTGRRRISLSLKAMTAPAIDEAEMMGGGGQDDDRDRRRRRKQRGDLRGGTGGSGKGGLFGNPNDFG